ncbi:MAG TPA: hypothetical protein VGJ77_06790 [Gaiellaceae bacterium]|jgi:hypothetical protein
MRTLLIGLLLTLAIAPSALAGTAQGGGRGTVDGTSPFSDFGFNVTTAGGIQGNFNCLMAGSAQFPGFTLMAVRGQVTDAVFAGDAASFDGAGMLQTGNQGKFPATYHVEVTAGGPGVGTLQLTLLTPFFFALPTEHVLVGRISTR